MKLKRFISFIVLAAFFTAILNNPKQSLSADETLTWPESPVISAEGAIIIEAHTGVTLFEKNSRQAFYPASTTKLMTSLLAIEQGNLSDIVTCSHKAIFGIPAGSSNIALNEGEQLTLEEMLYAVLLASASEASVAVAEHIGGTFNDFSIMMNERAAQLGCVNTHFVNPHGLDDEKHYSCAYDLALIMQQCIKYSTFTRISGSGNHIIPETNLTNVTRPIANTHLMLIKNKDKKIPYDGVFAGKTGHTSLAGYSLVTACERNGLTLICVIMKAPNQAASYTDTKTLLDFVYNNFELCNVSTSAESSEDNAFPFIFSGESALISDIKPLLTIEDATLVLPKGASADSLQTAVSLTQLSSFTTGKNTIGTVTYSYAGHEVGTSSLYYISDKESSVIPTPTPVSPVTNEEKPSSEDEEKLSEKSEANNKRALIVACLSGLAVAVIGNIIVLIIIPKIRRYIRRDYI